jgi:hypothetical protein
MAQVAVHSFLPSAWVTSCIKVAHGLSVADVLFEGLIGCDPIDVAVTDVELLGWEDTRMSLLVISSNQTVRNTARRSLPASHLRLQPRPEAMDAGLGDGQSLGPRS